MKRIAALACLLTPIIACDTTTPGTGGGGTAPANPPTSVSFSDTDPSSKVAGAVTIGRAIEESDISFYNIRFGTAGSCNSIGTQIAQLLKAGTGDLVYNMPSTTVPQTAEKILVFSQSFDTENPNCVETALNNDAPAPNPPLVNAQAVSFIDNDIDATVGGPINITKASDETTVSHYVIRWGDVTHCNIGSGSLIAEVPVTGSNIVYNLPSGTSVPAGAEDILVYTKNEYGETTDCDNVFATIVNNEAPPEPPSIAPSSVSFTDTDSEETIGGTITIGKASDESAISSYVLRWGDGGCNIGSGSLIAEVSITGADINYALSSGTVVPAGATQILAYSKNVYGEMSDCANAATDINNDEPVSWLQIRHTFSNHCLEAKNGTGPRINGSTCSASDPAQQWMITPNGSDSGGATYEIMNVATGTCIKDLGENDSNQSFFPIVEFFFELTPCGGTYQSFNIFHNDGTGSDEWFIRNRARNACFYRYAGSSYNNYDLYAAGGNCNWASLGYPSQKFSFRDSSGTQVDPPSFQ